MLRQAHKHLDRANLSYVEGLPDGNRLPRMAPNLAESQHKEIRDMILSRLLNAL
jgi:hypothetical protein